MENNKVNVSCSWPVAVIVFLAFFLAKIFDKIDWSWWLVFSPLWIPILLCIITLVVILGLKLWAEW